MVTKINEENKSAVKDNKFWYLRTIDEVLTEVGGSTKGLSYEEAKRRLSLYGKNTLDLKKSVNWYQILFNKFNSLLIYILFVAAIVSFFLEEILEFIVIILIILMTVLLGFFHEYKADRTISALKKLASKGIEVIRDNEKTEIPTEDLVIGDIVCLKRGDIVPADLRLIKVEGLEIDESHLTGESLYVSKSTKHLSDENINLNEMENMAFSSTHVTKGSAMGVVVETGLKSYIGKISSEIEHIMHEKSPIQKRIDKLSKKVSYIVICIAFVLLLMLLFRGESVGFSLVMIAAIAVAGIPESLPLALTMAFTNGIKKMAGQNAIVKDLNSVETLGTTNVICTDKTGTLTENKMRISEFFIPKGHIYEVSGSGYDPNNKFYLEGKEISISDVKITEDFLKACVLCNDSEVNLEEDEWKLIGEPTEGALMTLAKSFNAEEHVLRENNKRIYIEPFDPAKKYMVSVHENINKENVIDFYMKGAGEIVLDLCTYYTSPNGEVMELTKSYKEDIRKKIEDFNKNGLRVLSLASKSFKLKEDVSEDEFSEKIENNKDKDYVFEGFVGIEDPIREEVRDAVGECHKAGIKIVMITGDNKFIAEHIASRLEIYEEGKNRIIEGYELDKLNNHELDEIIEEITVFARTSPEHKLRIVDSFQRRGRIVAMTGDGVNDAPALKKAEIGVSMGKDGTEVAKEASNIVLFDDNFATIVKAVKEGRTVYSNIRRFVYFLLTGNMTELGLLILAIIIGTFIFEIPLPLTALLILFINLVSSALPALALGVEPTHEKVMRQKPRDPNENLLSNYIMIKIIVLLPVLIGGIFGFFFWEYFIASGIEEKAVTVAFLTLVMFRMFNSLNARRLHTTIFDKGFFNNPYIFMSILMAFFAALVVIQTSIGNEIFGTVPLELTYYLVCGAMGLSIILYVELIKLRVKAEIEEQSKLQGTVLKLE
ncbi:MAG: cation-translocating P-type ATPase [Candidatus Nanoarchaeia archaeon]